MTRRPAGRTRLAGIDRPGDAIRLEDFELTLRRLAVRDERFFHEALDGEEGSLVASRLDRKTHSLAQITALVAIDASPHSYAAQVEAARHAGATPEEIVGTLVAAIAVVGAPRVVSAAPKLGLALGYDLDAALEDDLRLRG